MVETSISIDTRLGKLRCVAVPDQSHPGFTIYWNERQIAVIENPKDAPIMRVYTWDTDAADPSTVVPIFPGYGE